ncbi:MAG: DNA-protecting protein DprA [Betaproteobacteria bacterium]|nr:DNA-protecting protein DprA [Betaproteobacteria bacterium]
MPIPASGSEPEAWISLHLIAGLGAESTRRLLQQFGSPAAVLSQNSSHLAQWVGPRVASAISEGAPVDKLSLAMRWLEADGNHLLTLADDDYPARLLEIADPPVILYMKGRRELLAAANTAGIAIVGSRNATPGGLQNAETFARALSDAGMTVISGMALGIDAAAHRGGMDGAGSTIAVVGTGLDLVYPARNRALAHQLAEKGLLVSEFALGTPALASNFPRRNRIISGLSRGVLVVEAALASGSLITARQAGEQGRDVFAIPGSIHSPFSKGCHLLIKQGAKLVDDAADILVELKFAPQLQPPTASGSNPTTGEEEILTAMGYDPVTIDALVAITGTPAEKIMARLTELELAGVIASQPGGKYQRLG